MSITTAMMQECHEHHHHDHDEECHGHHHHDGCGHEHHHHHADEVFTSWGMETIVPVTHEQLEDVLKRLSNTREFGDVLQGQGNASHRESRGVAVF